MYATPTKNPPPSTSSPIALMPYDRFRPIGDVGAFEEGSVTREVSREAGWGGAGGGDVDAFVEGGDVEVDSVGEGVDSVVGVVEVEVDEGAEVALGGGDIRGEDMNRVVVVVVGMATDVVEGVNTEEDVEENVEDRMNHDDDEEEDATVEAFSGARVWNAYSSEIVGEVDTASRADGENDSDAVSNVEVGDESKEGAVVRKGLARAVASRTAKQRQLPSPHAPPHSINPSPLFSHKLLSQQRVVAPRHLAFFGESMTEKATKALDQTTELDHRATRNGTAVPQMYDVLMDGLAPLA
ncbi:hypothetical protein BDK51DRAFT_40027 [Blyttiomyces helicus]|uniref:Uncharacterized protein n=1 Tax=Blyttiomyces helicus TaxID=388810 RepID=A0A4V1IQJ5_9FUNG|nr:hypothetical protein BDK51DRAFT_40027 [Blyttiomyces helicus]|eukprot:RKO86777.1 hypothetical protein BDK51DRAFT_40027 [Blyttiomyces helicus]